MIDPRIDDLLSKVDSKFTLVILASRRAREINGYYSELGQGIGQYVPPMVETEMGRKPLTVAMQEIAEGKLQWHRPEEVAAAIK